MTSGPLEDASGSDGSAEPMVQVLRKALASNALPTRFMCGVSGGIDSCTLLHALVAAGAQPVVVHYDHGWGAAAGEDPAFIGNLAANYGLQFHFDVANPPPARQREDEARRMRYAFFARQARELDCPDIVLAHNADDQVETLLMQMLRGGGSHAAGIRETSTRLLPGEAFHSEDDNNGNEARQIELRIHRPWLGVWRKDIEAYAAVHGVVWKEDLTNADPHHLRNRLRHQLIPQLQDLAGHGVKAKLHGFARTRQEEADWLDALCAPWAEKETLRVKELRALPGYALHRILWTWLRSRLRSLATGNLKRRDVENVAAMLAIGGPAKVNLPGGNYARRRAGVLFVDGNGSN